MGRTQQLVEEVHRQGVIKRDVPFEVVSGLATVTHKHSQECKRAGGVLMVARDIAVVAAVKRGGPVVEPFPYNEITQYDESYKWSTRWRVSLASAQGEALLEMVGSGSSRPIALRLLRDRVIEVGNDPDTPSRAHINVVDSPPLTSPEKGHGKPTAVRETRCTCRSCGNVWHYGKKELVELQAAKMHNVGKAMLCCSGCLPSVLIKDKEMRDLNQCPQCGSRNTEQETVTHEVE